MKTYMAKAADQQIRRWVLVDANDQILGRLAAKVARVLQGKHRPEYTPHFDVGDFVVVINAEKVRVTGRKREQKTYPYYTGWRGGYKEIPFADLIERDPARVIELAVKRMLPKSKLGTSMLGKLKAKADAEERALISSMEELGSKVAGLAVEVQARATEDGHLFGSVTEKDIHVAIVGAGWDVPLRAVRLPAHIKDAGLHTVTLHLYGEITADITVTVVPVDLEGQKIEVMHDSSMRGSDDDEDDDDDDAPSADGEATEATGDQAAATAEA